MVNTTASLIKVKDIRNDTLIMDDGSLRAVLAVPGINFSLLSEEEKEAVVGLFKELLDGLDFNLQILVISRFANIEGYINFLKEKLDVEEEPLIKLQLDEYIKFIESYVETHKIMKKIFYIVVTYESAVTEIGKFGSKKNLEEEFYQKLEQLETRVIFITEKLASIGLQPIRLNDSELLQLLYEMYNPNLKWGLAPIKLFEEIISTFENEA